MMLPGSKYARSFASWSLSGAAFPTLRQSRAREEWRLHDRQEIMPTRKQIAKRRARQREYDQSEAGRARRHRYNTGSAGKARNGRMRAKRRENPEYSEYRAKKLIWDRRNHFFRYTRIQNERMARFPWLRNYVTAGRFSRGRLAFKSTRTELSS